MSTGRRPPVYALVRKRGVWTKRDVTQAHRYSVGQMWKAGYSPTTGESISWSHAEKLVNEQGQQVLRQAKKFKREIKRANELKCENRTEYSSSEESSDEQPASGKKPEVAEIRQM